MSADPKVLAAMDCFHRYYRFREAARGAGGSQSRYEAWLDYKVAILRRDEQRCSVCGQTRSMTDLDVRPQHPSGSAEGLSPDNLVSVCVYCDRSAGVMLRNRRKSRLA